MHGIQRFVLPHTCATERKSPRRVAGGYRVECSIGKIERRISSDNPIRLHVKQRSIFGIDLHKVTNLIIGSSHTLVTKEPTIGTHRHIFDIVVCKICNSCTIPSSASKWINNVQKCAFFIIDSNGRLHVQRHIRQLIRRHMSTKCRDINEKITGRVNLIGP